MSDEVTVVRSFVPPGRTPRGILGGLSRAGYGVERAPAAVVWDRIFDTQGGRLARAGARLRLRAQAGEVRWRFEPRSGPALEAPCPDQTSRWPLFPTAEGVPDEAKALGAAQGLFPVIALKLSWSEASLMAPSGTRLTLSFETMRSAVLPFEPGSRPLGETLVTARFAEGDPAEAGYLAVYLRDRFGLAPVFQDACGLALKTLGRSEPGGHPPEALKVGPEDPMALAARKVLAQQALKLRANAEGTLLDLDPEYLHDMRVATRRLRSALKLFAPSLPARRAQSLRLELGWLAGLLGQVRDLDVFIAGLREQSGRLGDAARVANALEAELWARRGAARGTLVSGMKTKRFASLLSRLEALAGSPPPKRPCGVAARRADGIGPLLIGQAHRRVVKQGRAALPPQASSPEAAASPAALHRLRILFKRLRYASEFFAPVMGKRMEPLLQAMVQFQDCLGEHQDAVVAAARVDALAREMAARGDLPPEALLDLGGLIQVQREIARERRKQLAGLWKKFDRGSVRRCLAGDDPLEGPTVKPSPPARRTGTP